MQQNRSGVKNQRRRHFVDSQVQTAILLQAGLYWLYATATFVVVVLLFRVAPVWLSGGELTFGLMWRQVAPMVVSSAVLLPIVMRSALLFSHRFAGPMVRFRRALRSLSAGRPAPPIRLRDRDFWQDVADQINGVSARLSEERNGEQDESDESEAEPRGLELAPASRG